MNAVLLIKTIDQDRVGRAIFPEEFEFGVINHNVTVVLNPQLRCLLADTIFVSLWCFCSLAFFRSLHVPAWRKSRRYTTTAMDTANWMTRGP